MYRRGSLDLSSQMGKCQLGLNCVSRTLICDSVLCCAVLWVYHICEDRQHDRSDIKVFGLYFLATQSVASFSCLCAP